MLNRLRLYFCDSGLDSFLFFYACPSIRRKGQKKNPKPLYHMHIHASHVRRKAMQSTRKTTKRETNQREMQRFRLNAISFEWKNKNKNKHPGKIQGKIFIFVTYLHFISYLLLCQTLNDRNTLL